MQEGDEAFGAIQFALGEQLRQRQQQLLRQQHQQQAEGAGADPSELQQLWLDTLADTRSAFLEMVRVGALLCLLDSRDGMPGRQQCCA